MCKGFALDEMFAQLLNNTSLNYSPNISLFCCLGHEMLSEMLSEVFAKHLTRLKAFATKCLRVVK